MNNTILVITDDYKYNHKKYAGGFIGVKNYRALHSTVLMGGKAKGYNDVKLLQYVNEQTHTSYGFIVIVCIETEPGIEL